MTFWTEKQIEDWLTLETRAWPLPDGTKRHITVDKLIWSKADSLVLCDGYSRAKLTGYALEESQLQKVDFDTAFRGVVAFLDNRRRRGTG